MSRNKKIRETAVARLRSYLEQVHQGCYKVKPNDTSLDIVISDLTGARVWRLIFADIFAEAPDGSCLVLNTPRLDEICQLITERHDAKHKVKTNISWRVTNVTREHLDQDTKDEDEMARLTKDEKEEIRRRYRQGQSVASLAQLYRCSETTVYNHCLDLARSEKAKQFTPTVEPEKIESTPYEIADFTPPPTPPVEKDDDDSAESFDYKPVERITLPDEVAEKIQEALTKVVPPKPPLENILPFGMSTSDAIESLKAGTEQKIEALEGFDKRLKPVCKDLYEREKEKRKINLPCSEQPQKIDIPDGWSVYRSRGEYFAQLGSTIFGPHESLAQVIAVANEVSKYKPQCGYALQGNPRI